MLSRFLSRPLRFAAAAVALLSASAASAQITVQFGHSHGYGHGGYNPYRNSGFNPYAGGSYRRGGTNDWYYDQYRPRQFGGIGHTDADHHVPNWGAYRSPNLYGLGGPYQGYGYDHHHH